MRCVNRPQGDGGGVVAFAHLDALLDGRELAGLRCACDAGADRIEIDIGHAG